MIFKSLDEKVDEILDIFVLPGRDFDSLALHKLHKVLGNPYSGEKITANLTKQMIKEGIMKAYEDDGWVNVLISDV